MIYLNLEESQRAANWPTFVEISDDQGTHRFHFGRTNDEDFVKNFRGPIVQAAYALRQAQEQAKVAEVKKLEVARLEVRMVECTYCQAKNAIDKERCWRCGASDFIPQNDIKH